MPGIKDAYFEHTITSKGLFVVKLEGITNKAARDCVMRLHTNKARALVHRPRPSADAVRFPVRKNTEVELEEICDSMVEIIKQAIQYAHLPASERKRKKCKKSGPHSYNNNRRARCRKVVVPSR